MRGEIYNIENEKNNSIHFIEKVDIPNKSEVTDFSILLGKSNPNEQYHEKITTVDESTNEKLEQLHSDGSLNRIADIDTENFPQDIPDKETCAILADLYSKNQLPIRQVKYCIVNLANPIYMTDYFKEYSYNGRKIIKYQSSVSSDLTLSNGEPIRKSKFYWLEVKPTNLEKDKILYSESYSTEKGRRI